MTLHEALQNARVACYAEGNWLPIGEDEHGKVFKALILDDWLLRACGYDERLAGDVMTALDACAPGGNFHVWVDGGEWDGKELVFDGEANAYQRGPSDVAAIVAKAINRAMSEAA